MQIESVAHCGAATLSHTGGSTSHRVNSLPNVGTPLLESGTHSGSELRLYYGGQPETQNEQSDLPSYQEVMRGRFVELTPEEYGVLGNGLYLYLFCICFLKKSYDLCIVFIKNG